MIRRAFIRAPSGRLSLIVLGALLAIAVVAPILWTEKANALNVLVANEGPSASHRLGTDALGRDVLYRVLVATRLSLGLALSAALLGVAIGVPVGVATAFLPGRIRSGALRTIDMLLAFPGILIAIFIGAITGPGTFGATLGVGIAIAVSFARVASALALTVGGREYIAAARVVGASRTRLMFRYVLPNIAEVLAITTAVAISNAIVQVSSLSFLGLGVQAPQFDWGSMLTEGVKNLYTNPVEALGPASAIAVSALAFGFAGEALARAMNPVLWTRTIVRDGAAEMPPPAGTAPSKAIAVPEIVPQPSQPGDGEANGSLEVRNLSVALPRDGQMVPVLDGITFSMRKGETVGIVGESGSGKTMTAMAIAELLPGGAAVRGQILFDGVELEPLGRRGRVSAAGSEIAVVFQDPMSSLNPALRIGTQLTEVIRGDRQRRRHARALAEQRLREVNLANVRDLMHRHPHELSGGMRQRVMIAMGLMKDLHLLIADEPTTALDVTVQAQVMDLLAAVNRDHGSALILISHNLVLVSQNCRRVLVMYAGRLVEDLEISPTEFHPRHPYSRALLDAVPDLDRPRGEALTSIPGQAPDLASAPRGCAFHPRCPLAQERCSLDVPPLRSRTEGHRLACWVANEDLE